jgi:hypothetical protein
VSFLELLPAHSNESVVNVHVRWHQMLPSIVISGGDHRRIRHCGDAVLFDPVLRALPPLFVVKPAGPAAARVTASVEYAMQATELNSLSANQRLPELLFTEVPRIFLSDSASSGGSASHPPIGASQMNETSATQAVYSAATC